MAPCEICGQKTGPGGGGLSLGARSVVACPGCGVWVLSPFPPEGELQAIYQEDYYRRWEYRPDNLDMIRQIKHRLYASLLDRAFPGRRSGRLLDIGCAMGYSLEVARERGFEVFGLEISQFSGKIARENFGDAVAIGPLEEADFDGESFDVVTLVDLLEHIRRPVEFLERTRRILKPGGKLALVTPDTSSLSARLLRGRWPHLKEEHLYYFSPRSIRWALSGAGFSVEEIGPFAKPTTLQYMKSAAQCSSSQCLYRTLAKASRILPRRIRRACLDVPMGEMFAVARKE